jgi:putative hydrolase of the HAD superfamily
MVAMERRRVAQSKLALFDLDNTLFDREASYRKWAGQFVAGAGLGPDEVEWFVEADGDGYASRSQLWIDARERYRLSETPEFLLASYRAAYIELSEPDHEVHAALSTLRDAGWRIGIVSNGSMPQQADKAVRLGLMPLVDGFCASGEFGFEKPDPRIFNETIMRCTNGDSLHPDARWMVGDAPVPDICGGRSVGLRTIWIDRGRTWEPKDGEPPDITVGSVVEAVREILADPI